MHICTDNDPIMTSDEAYYYHNSKFPPINHYNNHDAEKTNETNTEPIHSITNMKCAVCENETSGGHTCPGCHRYVHIPCGRCSGEEGFGSNVWCDL